MTDSPPFSHMSGAGAAFQRTAGGRARPVHEPAHTITGKGTAEWHVEGWTGTSRVVVVTGQNSRTDRRGGTRRFERDVDVPAPTVTGQARSWRIEGRRGEA